MDGVVYGGPHDGLSRSLAEELGRQGWKVELHIIRDMDITPCKGCFLCWTRTPGICVLRDDGRKPPQSMPHSDILVLMGPCFFGTHSPLLKKALDRCIPFLLPFFRKIHGEVHHKLRYRNPPCLLAVITERPDEQESATYHRLIERNAINLGSPMNGVIQLEEDEGGDLAVRMVIEAMEGMR